MTYNCPHVCGNKTEFGYCKTTVCINPKYNQFSVTNWLENADYVQVIRCKDCKWWDKKDDAPYGYCMAMKHGFVSSHWEIGIYRTYKGDFYCADGERRE